ncbi:MAG: translocation/assembly module TamB domain-containing protein [Bacteroidales bacterium]|nr:translocation/assembly module TamB domain-containing protein [Bacteroidales bacterium]
MLILLLLCLLVAVQSPRVQTGLARYAASRLENSLGGHFSIGSIRLLPFNAVVVRDVVLIDDNPYTEDIYGRGHKHLDTLASIGRLSATLSLKSLFDHKGLHLNHVEVEDALFQFASVPDSVHGSNLSRVLRLGGGDDDDSPMTRDSIFTIDRVNIINGRYRMVSFWPGRTKEHGITYSDMDLTFNLQGHDVGFYGARCHAVVDHLDAIDKCGYGITDASGIVAVGQGKTEVRKVHFQDNGGSDLHLTKVILSYDGMSAWSNFIREVDLDVVFEPSHLVLGSISGFSGGTFYGCPFPVDIEAGRFKGTVNDFALSNLRLTNPTGGTSGTINGTCRGIPDTPNMAIDATLEGFSFTMEGLEAGLAELGARVPLKKMAPGTVFNLDGDVHGILNDFNANVRLQSAIGGMTASAKTLNVIGKKPISINARASSDAIDIGKLLGSSELGPCTMKTEARIRLPKGGPQIDVDRCEIDRLRFHGYDYSNLAVSGTMRGGDVEASVVSADPNAPLSLVASLNIPGQSGRVGMKLDNVDLAALNLDTRGGASRISCSISGEQGLDKESPADILISDLKLTNDAGTHDIGDIGIMARVWSEHWSVILNSDALDAKFDGTSKFAALLSDIKDVTVERYFPAYFTPSDKPADEHTRAASLNAVFHDTEGLLSFFMPELSIARGTALNLDLDEHGVLMGYIKSPLISYGGIKASGLELAMGNQDDDLGFSLNSDLLEINSISFNKAKLGAVGKDNLAELSLTYEGADLLEKGSELYIDAGLSRDADGKPAFDIHTRPSCIRIKNDTWELNEALITYTGKGLTVDDFLLASEDQGISISGATSPDSHEALDLQFHKLDLSILNDFLKKDTPAVSGIIDGTATLVSPFPSELGLGADLKLYDIALGDRKAGDFLLKSKWNDSDRRVDLNLTNLVGDLQKMQLSGSYGAKSKLVDAVLSLDGFDVGIAAPFLKGVLNDISGPVHGVIHAKGTPDKLRLTSDHLQLQDVRTHIAYTNVTYIINGTMTLDGSAAHFNGMGIKDTHGGIGVLNGTLSFKDLKDFRLDAGLDMSRLKAIEIPMQGEAAVYGDLAISGKGHISGPFDALYLDADISTAGDGIVHVPISSSSAAAGSDLLTFTKPELPEEASSGIAAPAAAKSRSSFSAHAKVNVSPEVTASIEIDKDSGHVLTAGGNGSVVLDLNTAKDRFQLRGDYKISKGKYQFTIPGIVSKEFEISDGSSIRFNGNVMESALDIKAVHQVKTSLSTIVADSTAVSSRRTVECGLNIGGKLKQPDVSFSIEVPDLDPNTKMKVDAALNTNDKKQKQFVALLLFGTFLPEEGAGVVNGTNMLFSNVGEIVSGQLNNILQKLEIPLDFGFGYQQDNGGTDLFDVAVSTQLFNNRIIVNGSVGNRKYSTSTNPYGDVVGDIEIGYKIFNNGELVVKAFSHSADQFTSSLDYSQRNGAGLTYQKEYNTFGEFFRQLFMSKQRKAQEALLESEKEKKMKVIRIER